jgi:selenium metabolism protein YedF
MTRCDSNVLAAFLWRALAAPVRIPQTRPTRGNPERGALDSTTARRWGNGMEQPKLLVINNETMGSGSDELGAKLMGSFLRKLCAAPTKPAAILFYNSGVKLLADGSSVLDALQLLAGDGVDLVACGTCCGFYGVTERLAVGRVSDMAEIVGRVLETASVVTV